VVIGKHTTTTVLYRIEFSFKTLLHVHCTYD